MVAVDRPAALCTAATNAASGTSAKRSTTPAIIARTHSLDVAVTAPARVPTTKEQCKHGGWREFPQVKNQGDCVAFVATQGKNPPSSP